MQLILLFSIFIKGIGAILEILIQFMITRTIGVSAYGTYSFYINVSDIIFWIFFSGIVKINTYYLSDKESNINLFKKRYYFLYVIPIIIVIIIYSFLSKTYVFIIIANIVLFQLMMQSNSSSFMARGKYNLALTLEYLIGRIFLTLGILIVILLNKINIYILTVLYCMQFLLVCVIFFVIDLKNENKYFKEKDVDLKKYVQYQLSDVINGLITQSPVILQYIFVGAFETGFTGIITIVRKLVNFVSGPTAKVFLPEFSKLYRRQDYNGLISLYSTIIKIQMLFISCLSILLLGFPSLVLKIFSAELLQYKNIFIWTSLAFLICSSLGPTTGFLQMTNNENKDNVIRLSTVVLMILTWIIFRKNSLFALFGMIVQLLIETIGKYIYICYFLKKSPINIKEYLKLWIPSLLICVLANILYIQNNYLYSFIFIVISCVFVIIIQVMDKQTRELLLEGVKKLQKKG